MADWFYRLCDKQDIEPVCYCRECGAEIYVEPENSDNLCSWCREELEEEDA